MGIFNKDDKQSVQKTGTTIISDGTFIRGGIDTAGSVFVDGKFEGVVVAGESLTIGKTGEVIGEVRVKNIVVSGLLDGIIDVEDVHILETGKVLGKMQYQNMIIEKHGVFEGEGKMKNSNLSSKYKGLQKFSPNEQIIQKEDIKIEEIEA